MDYINIFGLRLDIDRVAFTLPIGDGWPVYWYGIIIATGFLLAVIYAMFRAKSFGIDSDKLMTATLVTAVLSVLCGRLYYVLFDPNVSLSDFFRIHDGGLAIPGAIIGAVLFGALMCKIEKIDLLSAFDLMAIGFFIGQAIGRWGNFINQEAYGTFTGSSWFGMTGSKIAEDVGSVQLVHPCFLYESIWCALGFVLLHILSYHRKFKGELGCVYMIWYGVERAVVEGLRTDALKIGSARVTQLLCVAAAIVGVVFLVLGLKMAKKKKVVIGEYENQFDNPDEFDRIENDVGGTVKNDSDNADDADEGGKNSESLGENISASDCENNGKTEDENNGDNN